MAKLTAWLVTLIGVVMVLGLIPGMAFNWGTLWVQWVLALVVLLVGVTKLMRNYKMMKKRR